MNTNKPPTPINVQVEIGKLRGMVLHQPGASKARDCAIEELEREPGLKLSKEWDEYSALEKEVIQTARRWKHGECATPPSQDLLQ